MKNEERLKVLIIDDNPQFYVTLKEEISKKHDVKIVTNLDDTYNVLVEGWDLFLVDLNIESEKDGFILIEHIQRKYKKSKIIVVTNDDSRETTERVLSKRGYNVEDLFIKKKYLTEDWLDKINEICNEIKKNKKTYFISYSKTNKEFAFFIKKQLEEGCIGKVIIDKDSFKVGANLDSEIPKYIEVSDIFVLILSKSALSSKWVEKEIKFALEEGKELRIIKMEEFELPKKYKFNLSNIIYIPFYEYLENFMTKLE
ncbi:MAG: TIR domain-containing protein [Bacteroidota bacterium]